MRELPFAVVIIFGLKKITYFIRNELLNPYMCCKSLKTEFVMGKRYIWTEEALSLLGTKVDRLIADELGIKPSAVSRKRNILGIQPVRTDFVFPEEALPLLGVQEDDLISDEFNISAFRVRQKRVELGIKSPYQRQTSSRWQGELLNDLGQMSDREWGEKHGLHPDIGRKKRKELGILPYRVVEWTSEMISELGVLFDKTIAEKHNITVTNVTTKRRNLGILVPVEQRESYDWKSVEHRMGVDSDWNIAFDLGATPDAVRRKRHRLGIPNSGQSKRANLNFKWTSDYLSLLGEISDYHLSMKMNTTISTIHSKRKELGILSYRGN